MFETVSPEAFGRHSRRVLYQTLPMSLLVHGLAVTGAIGMVMSHLEFPQQSPPLVRAYLLATIPDPPPPPPPPAPKQQPQPAVPPKPVMQPTEIVAPTIIPDLIPVITNDIPVAAPVAAPPAAPQPPSAGVEGGMEGGVAGGVPDALPVSDGRLHVKLGAPLPMKTLRQDYPEYPEDARSHGYEDNLLVRYTIGKDGRVKDIVVVDPPARKVFEDAVMKVMHAWRFRPYTDEAGQPQEVVHEVSFNFQLH